MQAPVRPARSPLLLWHHRELLWQFVRRGIEAETKGSTFGILWLVLTPLLLLTVYTTVFGVILGGSFHVGTHAGRFDYALGIFLGLNLMSLLNESMGRSASAVLAQGNLVQKVVFPLEILPTAAFGVCLFRFLTSSLVMLLMYLAVGPQLSLQVLWLPVILLPYCLLCLGLAWGFSAVGVYFRDLAQLLGVIGLILFYASAVFYSPRVIPPQIYEWLRFNPALQVIELTRKSLLWGEPMPLRALLYLYGVGTTSATLGWWLFRRLKRGFADVI